MKEVKRRKGDEGDGVTPTHVDSTAGGSKTTSPPPDVCVEEKEECMATPSTDNNMKTGEGDLCVTQLGRDVGPQDGVCGENTIDDEEYVCSPGQHGILLRDEDDIVSGGGGDDSMRANDDIPVCVFKRGWCKTHNIKGDRRTTKTRKWTKKKYGYG